MASTLQGPSWFLALEHGSLLARVCIALGAMQRDPVRPLVLVAYRWLQLYGAGEQRGPNARAEALAVLAHSAFHAADEDGALRVATDCQNAS